MSMVGRRGLLKTLGLAPLARGGKHKHRETPVGWNNQNVFAQLVIIYGTGELGLFIYNGQPANGNPPVAWATPTGVSEDPSGNTLPASGGFVSFSPASRGVSQLVDATLILGNPTDPGTPASLIANTPSANLGLVIQSGDQGGSDVQSVITVAPKSLRAAPGIVISPNSANSGTTAALLEVLGTMALAEQASTPGTPVAAGILYVDSTGHLHYLGPGGTNTILAGP